MRHLTLLAAALAIAVSSALADDEPWLVTGHEVITEPTRLGHTIVLPGASLRVEDVPEPGLELEGHLWVIGDGEVHLLRSVVRILSEYHGQYQVAGIDDARIEVRECDYQVVTGVQHAIFSAGRAETVVADSDFGFAQLLAADDSRLVAERTNGDFEILVQHSGTMELRDLPRDPGEGRIWVWVEFGEGSVATYSPPPTGPVVSWRFPDDSMAGIPQSVVMERCEVFLWPMLVRPGSDLTLADIDEDNWVIVGLHLPSDAVIVDMVNGRTVADGEVALPDRTLRLENASIDTWNLYPQSTATVEVRDSWLGEILAMGESVTRVEDTVIDGTGGFLGARDHSRVTTTRSRITCTIEAAQESRIHLHDSVVEPYEVDPDGVWTRLGAYDDAIVLVDHTTVETTPALGGDGVIAAAWLDGADVNGELGVWGSFGLYSLDEGPGFRGWRVFAAPSTGVPRLEVGRGTGEVDGELIGIVPLDAGRATLVVELEDGRGRVLRAARHLSADGPSPRPGARRP